ncbi:MAG: ribosome silencing factor [Treponema sp.]|jgi:ribosome-associated protein|nr:ribosome silencing factor [Treponema sp.]
MDDMLLAADAIADNTGRDNAGLQTGGFDHSAYSAAAADIGRLLAEHNGREVVALDLRGLNAWTDFFVIAGVTSNVHMQGLERQIKEFCRARDIEIARVSTNPSDFGEEWKLIDLGAIAVHLMTEKARSFYELERLWSHAKVMPLRAALS